MLQADWNSILIAYNVLTCFAVIFVTIVLALPIIFKSLHRRFPWYSHLLAWLVVSISLTLSIGHQYNSNPPTSLCFLQSTLLYATPPLATFSMACYLIDINLLITSIFHENERTRLKKSGYSIVLAITPWLIFLLVIVEVSIVHSLSPGTYSLYPLMNKGKEGKDPNLNPSGSSGHLVCVYHNRISNIMTGLLVIFGGLLLLVAKVWTAFIFFRNYKSYKWTSIKIAQTLLSGFIRTTIFTGFSLVGIILGQIGYMQEENKRGWCLVFPLMPIIAAAVYGMHMDVLRSLTFWKNPTPIENDNNTTNSNTSFMCSVNRNPPPSLTLEFENENLSQKSQNTVVYVLDLDTHNHTWLERHDNGEESKLGVVGAYNKSLLASLPGPDSKLGAV